METVREERSTEERVDQLAAELIELMALLHDLKNEAGLVDEGRVTRGQWIDLGAGTRHSPLAAASCTCGWDANTTELVSAMVALGLHRGGHGQDRTYDGYEVALDPSSWPAIDRDGVDRAFAEAAKYLA